MPGDRDDLEAVAVGGDQRGARGAAHVLGADHHARLFHRRNVDDVLRGQLARGRHDRGADGDRRGRHRGLLDHVAALAAQRAADATTHDAQRVRRVDHGVDGHRPEIAFAT